MTGRAIDSRVRCTAHVWTFPEPGRDCPHPARFEWIYLDATEPRWHPVCGIHVRGKRRQYRIDVRELA